MAEHIENLKCGDWVAVTGQYVQRPAQHHFISPFGSVQEDAPVGGDRVYDYSNMPGQPERVIAVSVPFVLLEGVNGRNTTIDIREYTLTRLDRRYVRAFLKASRGRGIDNASTPMDEYEVGDARPYSERMCPCCATKMHERLHEGHQVWLLVCPECGFTGGRGPDQLGKNHGT
jgi:hypothetical protein